MHTRTTRDKSLLLHGQPFRQSDAQMDCHKGRSCQSPPSIVSGLSRAYRHQLVLQEFCNAAVSSALLLLLGAQPHMHNIHSLIVSEASLVSAWGIVDLHLHVGCQLLKHNELREERPAAATPIETSMLAAFRCAHDCLTDLALPILLRFQHDGAQPHSSLERYLGGHSLMFQQVKEHRGAMRLTATLAFDFLFVYKALIGPCNGHFHASYAGIQDFSTCLRNSKPLHWNKL